MPRPYALLPSVAVPPEVVEAACSYDVSWSQREVVNIFRAGRWTPPTRDTLSPSLCGFLDEVCKQHQLVRRNQQEDSLLLFGDVERHNDAGFYVGNLSTPARFLQIVVKGEAELRFPGLRERSLRSLPLKPGTVFVMNPKLYHEVRGASSRGVATLSAVVPYSL